MAGTSYFNSGSRNAVGESPFYKLKNIPLPSKTNFSLATNSPSGLPVFRSAVANNVFRTTGSTNIKLVTLNANGTETTVTNVATTTYLAGSVRAVLHLNTTDQCLYVLCVNSGTYQLLKITDGAGTTSTIGSSFTPTTAGNWPTSDTTAGLGSSGVMYVDGAGHLRVYCNGYYHQINRTTGAIVSQDTAVTIGSYNLKDTTYLTTDSAIASSILSGSPSSNYPYIKFRNITSSISGMINSITFPDNYVLSGKIQSSPSDATYITMVDSDKVFIGSATESTNIEPFGYFYRSDFDQFLQSVVDWYAGA